MLYFAKTPRWLKKLYRQCIWGFSANQKTIYLTFDDGPHPIATPFVLDELNRYNAKATFFCIGKNVVEQNVIYKRVLDEGHSVGNHTHNHLNGWETENDSYINNIQEARKHIRSNLFRPPYGKIKKSQIKLLQDSPFQFQIIMWSILSGDFDVKLSPQSCLENVIKNAKMGSVVVFHDSEKAFGNLVYTLPRVLEYFSSKGFTFEKIPD
jgi:peptidoglycan/xylan/chitin deacetylase (PgdA/CDA1 family)